MGYKPSYDIRHGNRMSLPVDEGVWTDDSDYKEGGYFATPVKPGDFVKLEGTEDFVVIKAGSAETPIGVIFGQPMGKNEEYGRVAVVELFCYRAMEVTLSATSLSVAIGDSVCYDDANEFAKAVAANDTLVLQAGDAEDKIGVLFGLFDVAGTKDTL